MESESASGLELEYYRPGADRDYVRLALSPVII